MRVALVLVSAALAAGGCSGGDNGDSQESGAAPTAPTTTQRQADSSDGDVFGRIPEVVVEVEPSVVAVAVEGQQGRGEGSGVIWDDEGLIVTNNHVVAGAANLEVVLASGERVEAEVEEADPLSDLAILRVDRDGLPAADFAEELPEVGELAIAIGNPSGFEQSVTAGIVSGLHRAIPSGGQTPALVDLIQTDAAISPGNSGGALVDADGDVIGINVAYLPPQSSGAVSIGFAIPSPTAVSIVRQLLDTGEVERAFLGINPVQITPELADQFGLEVESGAGVERVEPGSAADEGGLRGGDVIVAFEGEDVATIEDLFAQLRKFQPGDEVTLTVVRDGERRELEVTLAERPSE
jgi:S1-C subfamily serine protease